LASDRSTGMYRGKLRAVLDSTKLRGSRGDAEWERLGPGRTSLKIAQR
jgi:hypothetical protein